MGCVCWRHPTDREGAKVAFFLWPWQVWYYIFRNSLDYADVGSSYDMVHSNGKNIIWNKNMWLQKDRFACRSYAHLAQFLTVWLTDWGVLVLMYLFQRHINFRNFRDLFWKPKNLIISLQVVKEGQWWRAITASFSHISLIHLGFNMITVKQTYSTILHAFFQQKLPFFHDPFRAASLDFLVYVCVYLCVYVCVRACMCVCAG